MRKWDVVFLIFVGGIATAFAAASVSQAVRLWPSPASTDSPLFGAAGRARDVNMRRFEELLRDRSLSGHEAEFYKPATSRSRQDANDREDRPL